MVALVATGSEVALALDAAGLLEARGIPAVVVSMPWRERFAALDEAERDAILPSGVPVVVVEAGVAQGWEGLAAGGALACLDRFGASGPGHEVQAALGFTASRVADVALEAIANTRIAVDRDAVALTPGAPP